MISIRTRDSLTSLFLFFFFFGFHLLRIVRMRQGRQNSKFAQNPRDAFAGLRSNSQPVLQTVSLEANFLHACSVGNWIVGSHYFQESSVSWGLGIGGHHAIKRSMGFSESLQAQSNWHDGVYVCWRCTRRLYVCLSVFSLIE
jgi:hypothetical protein